MTLPESCQRESECIVPFSRRVGSSFFEPISALTNLYDAAPSARRPVVTHALSHLDETQQDLYDLLRLERYRAK
ncbi:MAG: hypothetical protein V2A73_20340 [Pseudomonadota bacterium]